jgi:hypothetical protein
MSISLNGFKVELSAQSLKAHVQALPNNQEVEPLRQALGDEWFLHWRQGKLYGIPRVTTPQKPFGQPEELNCNEHEHLQLLTSRISDLLPGIFSSYDPLKRKPFTFSALPNYLEVLFEDLDEASATNYFGRLSAQLYTYVNTLEC